MHLSSAIDDAVNAGVKHEDYMSVRRYLHGDRSECDGSIALLTAIENWADPMVDESVRDEVIELSSNPEWWVDTWHSTAFHLRDLGGGERVVFDLMVRHDVAEDAMIRILRELECYEYDWEQGRANAHGFLMQMLREAHPLLEEIWEAGRMKINDGHIEVDVIAEAITDGTSEEVVGARFLLTPPRR